MKATTTRLTIAAAARYADKSPTTIRKHIDDGELSVEVLKNGKKRIDVSELHRVYGDDCKRIENGPSKPEPKHDSKTSGNNGIQVLKDQLEKEVKERERERKHFENQLDTLEAALEKSQEGHNRTTLLLKHHSEGAKDWEPILQKLQSDLSDLQEGKEDKAKKLRKSYETHLAELQRKLTEEQSKPFWKKLFNV